MPLGFRHRATKARNSTVHNWGEDSRGLWKLKIADRVPGNTGTLNSATLTLYGTAK